MKIDEAIAFCTEKSNNIKLKAEPQVFIQLAKWLEELKILREEKSEFQIIARDNYEIGYNKAVDDFAEKIKSNNRLGYVGCLDKIVDELAKQLKAGEENE